MSDETATSIAPYRGLAAFGDDDLDARLFFGRERETDLVVANLEAARLTILYGASGVGKSSLLHAGVAHRLRKVDEGAPRHVVAVCDAWRGDPVAAVTRAANAAVEEYLGHAIEPAEGRLADRFQALSEAIEGEIYLVLDQFEEYVLYHGATDGGPLAAELADVVNRPSLRVGVLLGVRDDALAELDALKALVPTVFSNLLRVDHLTREDGREAILAPLDELSETGGTAYSAEAALVDAVLDGVALPASTAEAGAHVIAPFLQLVMARVWDAEQLVGSATLRLETLERLGGPERIVEDHLEQALSTLDPDERDIAAHLFGELVTPSGTKIAHSARDLAQYVELDVDALLPVLEQLAAARILVPVADDRGGERRYEILHDVLAEAVLAWSLRHEANQELERTKLEARRRHRRLAAITGVSLVGLACAIALTVWALTERSNARDRAVEAKANELQALAVNALPTDSALAVALAVEAVNRHPSPTTQDVLRRALLGDHLLRIVPAGSPVTVVDAARGKLLLGTADRKALVLDERKPDAAPVVIPQRGIVTVARLDEDGAWTGDVSGLVRFTSFGTAETSSWSLRHQGPVVAVTDHSGPRCGQAPCFVVAGGSHVTTWDWSTRKRLGDIFIRSPIRELVTLSSGKVAALSDDSVIRVIDPATQAVVKEIATEGEIETIASHPHRELLAAGFADGSVQLWNVATGRSIVRYTFHSKRVLDLDLAGDSLLSGGSDGTAWVRSLSTGESIGLPGGTANLMRSVELTPDGKFALTAGADRIARVWETKGGRVTAVLAGHVEDIVDATFADGAQRVLTGSLDGTARLWSSGVKSDLVRSRVPAPGLPVRRAVASDGATAVIDGNTVRLHTAAGRDVQLAGHHDAVLSVAFSPDGARLVSTSRDHDARLWDAATGALIHRLEGHAGAVRDARFSSDGRWIVTAGPVSVGLWSAATGERLQFLYGPHPLVRAVSFADGERAVVTTETDGTVRRYRCVVCGAAPALLAEAEARMRASGRVLTPEEQARYLGSAS